MGQMDPQWVALARGLRPMLREVVGAQHLPTVLQRARALGLAVRAVPGAAAVESGSGKLRLGSGEERILFVAREAARAQDAVRLEISMRQVRDSSDGSRQLGVLLGYPPCCIDAWCEVEGNPDLGVAYARSAARTQEWDGRLNQVPGMPHLVPWFPCRFDCPASAAFVEQLVGRWPTWQGVGRPERAKGVAGWRVLLHRTRWYLDGIRQLIAAPEGGVLVSPMALAAWGDAVDAGVREVLSCGLVLPFGPGLLGAN